MSFTILKLESIQGRFKGFLVICLIIMLGSSCASFSQVGTRTVEHRTRRVGPVSEGLIRYHAPRGISFPTEESPKLVLKCEKEVDLKIEYKIPTHEEKILKRRVTKFQDDLEEMFEGLGDDDPLIVFGSVILIPVWICLSPLILFFGGSYEQTRHEKIPGSDRTKIHYKQETQTISASGIMVEVEGIGSSTTDGEGVVVFNATPSIFDRGVQISHGGSGQRYTIRRTEHIRTHQYKPPWRDEVKVMYTLAGAWLTIKRIKNIIALGGGPLSIAGAVIFDLATGLAVGYIIDIATTETETKRYYRWSIIPLN